MNHANHKTTLNTIKANVILAGILANICANGYIMHQLGTTLTKQEEIIQSQNKLIEKVNNTYSDKTTEVDTVYCKSVQVENLTASSGNANNAKSKTNKDNENAETLEEMKIPNCDTSFKAYMDYRCITNKASDQYKLQLSAWTDNMGLRRVDDYYLVAMGTYYSDNIGDKFRITLEGDKAFDVMIGDVKADIHTDKNNMYSTVYNSDGSFKSANVIEFIVDKKTISKKVKLWGDVSAYDEFAGNIVKIERISDLNE